MSNFNPHNVRRLAIEEAAYNARHSRDFVARSIAARIARGRPSSGLLSSRIAGLSHIARAEPGRR